MTSPCPEAGAGRATPSRRDVLAAGAAGLVWSGLRAVRAEEAPLPRRPFGRTGFASTVFGLGCFPLGSLPDEDAAIGVILRALDAGCNYLDTAPSYAQGRSEERVGRALRERPALDVFVATKTVKRTSDEARRDLETSLRRLGRDRIDLVQVHAVKHEADLDRVLAPDGTLAALVRAQAEGLVRFVGVTGHADPSVVRTAFERHAFDSVLFPLNCVDPHHLSFQETTLPAAVENGLARVAMKAFASGGLVRAGLDPEDCLRYTYGLDVSCAIVGCRTTEEVDLAVRVARDDRPLSPEASKTLLASTRPHAGKSLEWYKRE